MCGLFMIVPMAMFIILQAICKDECECENQTVINVENHALPSCGPLFLEVEEPNVLEVVEPKVLEVVEEPKVLEVVEEPKVLEVEEPKVLEVEVKEDMKLIFASNVLFKTNHTKIYKEKIQISGGRTVDLRIFS